jgi:hypothetical protein
MQKTENKKTFNFKFILNKASDYLIRLFLLPWSIVWFYWAVLTVLMFFVRDVTSTNLTSRFPILFLENQTPLIFDTWLTLSLFLFVNYTINFLVVSKIPRLQYFILFISFLILFLYSINLFPFVITKLGNI